MKNRLLNRDTGMANDDTGGPDTPQCDTNEKKGAIWLPFFHEMTGGPRPPWAS
jgi:hypothetical protein